MKVLKKKEVARRGLLANVVEERKILAKTESPFLVKLNFAFQSDKKLYLVMDYCPGGELFYYLSTIGRFREDSVKFYGAAILLALEALHKGGIIYRDLKPENVLIGIDGYPVLADFGLSKHKEGEVLTGEMCGTPEYVCPEALNNQIYTLSSDWWGLGCIIYEMLTRGPPFTGATRKELFAKITHD